MMCARPLFCTLTLISQERLGYSKFDTTSTVHTQEGTVGIKGPGLHKK